MVEIKLAKNMEHEIDTVVLQVFSIALYSEFCMAL